MTMRPGVASGTTVLVLALISGCSTNLASFERTLAARDSATAALGEWCRARAIAEPPVIRAEVLPGSAPAFSDSIRRQLDLDGTQPVGYRHVRLACGDTVLSVAHNWYVPGRLSPEMNQALSATDTPFGKVIAPLRFTREPLVRRRGADGGCPRGTVLSHRAMLRLPDGRPLSLLVECYTRANLAR